MHQPVHVKSTQTGKKVQIFACVLPVALSGQVVHDGGRGHRLPCARRTLDQTEGTLQHRLYSVHLYYKLQLQM